MSVSFSGILGMLLVVCMMASTAYTKPVAPESCRYNNTDILCHKSLQNSKSAVPLLRDLMKNLLASYLSFNVQGMNEDICTSLADRFLPHGVVESERLIQIQKVLAFMHASLREITREQQEFNPNCKTFHSELEAVASQIASLASNVACMMCERHNTPVTVEVPQLNRPSGVFRQKQWSCSVLSKSALFFRPDLISEGP
ncbi:leukemia inhibitory factor-like [Acipenser ruthenus]|uniref:leukemia inhibitory factor-like n=1 Tax=Acipenser ruthenus TaxID=7906 RepID=UPI00274265F0|nr:leukemia inhibitory factor-like [Acipenser ruthenus]